VSTARPQRRIAGLEALAPAHQSPMCILIVGMAPPGREWMPEEFSLPDGCACGAMWARISPPSGRVSAPPPLPC
jgi:hypothetical protein